MGFSKFLVVAVSALSMSGANAAEVDQYTKRQETIEDSSILLNEKANAAILSAIKQANDKNRGCNEEELYDELREYFSNHFKGKLTKDILSDPRIVKRVIGLPESIYQDWTMWDGIGMGFALFGKSGLTMSGVMRVGDQTIGTDKLEHMFGQGFVYFKKNYLKEQGKIRAVKRGIFGEKFLLGGNKIGNGVFSYGDLGANFNGMRFWNHMLQLRNDVLGVEHNFGPYITCANNQWVEAKKIDFKNYIDDSMDESINCSKYPTQNTADRFSNRLKMMGATCPLDQSRLDDLIVKYGDMAKWIINPDGIGKVKYFREFKDK